MYNSLTIRWLAERYALPNCYAQEQQQLKQVEQVEQVEQVVVEVEVLVAPPWLSWRAMVVRGERIDFTRDTLW